MPPPLYVRIVMKKGRGYKKEKRKKTLKKIHFYEYKKQSLFGDCFDV